MDKIALMVGKGNSYTMSDPSGACRCHEPDYHRVHVAAATSLLAGVAALAAGAFVLSYGRLHEIAVSAGVPPSLAGLYPLIFDAALVVACASAVALRSAAGWIRGYAAIAYMILICAIAVIGAVPAAGMSLPERPTAAVLAAMPWVLFLFGFGLGLSFLKHRQMTRVAARPRRPGDAVRTGGALASQNGLVNQPSRTEINQHSREEMVSRGFRKPAVSQRPQKPVVNQRPADLDWHDDDLDEPYVRIIPAPPKPVPGNEQH